MKITCQSCQAKYTIADDKVLGKIVKIRCKKCSSTIVVNGSDPSGAPAYGAPEGGADYGGQGSDEAWTVNVGDGDQRTMTDAEIVAAYQQGVVGAETFCWKDGMNDWLPLREIDALFEACNATRAIPAQAFAAPAPEYAAATGNGASGGAARRAGGRAPGADLFHGAAQAGSEEDVMTSAPVGAPQAYDEPKATGARNENSVLFSLSALTSKGTDRPPPVPGVEASGLIDIRQLSAQMGRGDDKKRSRVDDIMNLSSGGAFNGALSAPALSAPAIDQYGPPPGELGAGGGAAPAKSKTLIFLAIGAGAFVIVGAIGATMMFMHGKGTDTDSASASASAAAMGAPTATASAATTAAVAPATASAAAPEATAAATDTAAATAAATTAAPTATAAPVAAPVATTPPTPHVQAAVAQTAPAPTHTAAPSFIAAAEASEPFNMGEAKARLGAAAAAVQSCKKGDAPVGTGHVVVVFAPSGGAQTATINGPPFDGTPTGACVAARFRGVHVPPFSGSPFSVSKSFTIN